MLMWNWNLMGDSKVEEVAAAVLVSLIFEILILELISQMEEKEEGPQSFPQQRNPVHFTM